MRINTSSSKSFYSTPQNYEDFSSSKLENYEKFKLIATDFFGEYYLYTRIHNGLQTCRKFINIIRDGVTNYSDLEPEIKILRQMDHQNIAKYTDHFVHDDKAVIVLEYVEGKYLRESLIIRDRLINLFQKNSFYTFFHKSF
jgi:serine/threonine protein kinase